ncbi:zinc metallopeptidase [Myroides sp. LJL115]
MGIWIFLIICSFLGYIIQGRLNSRMEKYSTIALANGRSGAEIAQQMLFDHGIYDVKVISTAGRLTDHYNPMDKTVNLSEVVYNERNAAAAAVAAHEVGHAVQHAYGYKWLKLRSNLVPIVNISSRFVPFLLLGGVLLINSYPSLLLLGIIMLSLTTLFTVITLPVEYDASHRALQWLEKSNMVNSSELGIAKDSLKWAARTYLIAAISSLGTLLYYVSIFQRRN